MAQFGPVPKRSDERIRRNIAEPIDKIEISGEVDIPDLGFDDPHPMIRDFYDSLAESGQAKFYEPSDWQYARIVCHFLDDLIKSSKPSAVMLGTLSSMLTEMLVSEGSRRRVRLEIERGNHEANVIDLAARFEEMVAQ